MFGKTRRIRLSYLEALVFTPLHIHLVDFRLLTLIAMLVRGYSIYCLFPILCFKSARDYMNMRAKLHYVKSGYVDTASFYVYICKCTIYYVCIYAFMHIKKTTYYWSPTYFRIEKQNNILKSPTVPVTNAPSIISLSAATNVIKKIRHPIPNP